MESSSGNALSLAGLIMAAVGGLFILVGIGIILRRRAFLARALSAEGTVTRLDESRDLDSGSVRYAAFVRFSTPDGRSVEFRDPSSSSRPPELGANVPVRYDPRNPDKARIHAGPGTWAGPVVFTLLGAGLLAGGLVLMQSD